VQVRATLGVQADRVTLAQTVEMAVFMEVAVEALLTSQTTEQVELVEMVDKVLYELFGGVMH
jgi:hypothetical protein